MKTFKFIVKCGNSNVTCSEFIELEDDLSEDDVNNEWVSWAWDNINGSHDEVIAGGQT